MLNCASYCLEGAFVGGGDPIAVLGLKGDDFALPPDCANIFVVEAGHHAPIAGNVGLKEGDMGTGEGYADHENKREKEWF